MINTYKYTEALLIKSYDNLLYTMVSKRYFLENQVMYLKILNTFLNKVVQKSVILNCAFRFKDVIFFD